MFHLQGKWRPQLCWMQKTLYLFSIFKRVKLSMEGNIATCLDIYEKAIKSRCLRKLTETTLFHQDNAPAHKSLLSAAALSDCVFKLINHLPYSSDFTIICSLKWEKKQMARVLVIIKTSYLLLMTNMMKNFSWKFILSGMNFN